MQANPNILTIVRSIMGLLFIVAGITNIYFQDLLIPVMAIRKVPFPGLTFWIGIAIEIAGGILIIFNKWILQTVLLLILFVILATLMFHNFWDMNGNDFRIHMADFMTNIFMICGLILLAYLYTQ